MQCVICGTETNILCKQCDRPYCETCKAVCLSVNHELVTLPQAETAPTAPAPVTNTVIVVESRDIDAERKMLQDRIASLEHDLELIRLGKDAAERALEYERQRARELAQNSAFSLKRDWVALVNELRILKGETLGEGNAADDTKYQEALVIDFANRLRMGALEELEQKDDETLYVIAKAYEIWYKASSAVLQGRAIRLKVEKSQEFEQTKKDLKKRETEDKTRKEREKLDKRRKTPYEKAIENAMALGMSQEEAEELVKKVQGLKPEQVA